MTADFLALQGLLLSACVLSDAALGILRAVTHPILSTSVIGPAV